MSLPLGIASLSTGYDWGTLGLNSIAGYITPLCAKVQDAIVLLVLLGLFLIKGIGAVNVTGA